MRRRAGWIGAVSAVLAAVAVGVYPLPAGAHGNGTTFQQVNLVSDQPGVAAFTDPDLVNAWGMSHGPNTPLWVSNNGSDNATLYRTDTPGAPVTKQGLIVKIPGGAPTGQVFNDTTEFNVPGTTGKSLFVFAGEDGDLSAWNGAAGTSAVPAGHVDGAVFKGLAIDHSPFGPLLLAANFHDNRLEVFDGSFNRVPASDLLFRDRFLPSGYAPFNVAEIGNHIFVTYAKQDADAHDDVAGAGHGFVDVFTNDGRFVHRFASRGVLNSPWGLTVAPASFGQFAGDILIGNFGDGRIHAFDWHGHLRGTLSDSTHHPIVIDGLWGLIVGDAAAGGADAVWFSAGPDEESHGLLGVLRASS